MLRQRKLISQNLTLAKHYLREKYIFHISRELHKKYKSALQKSVVNFPLVNGICDLRQLL